MNPAWLNEWELYQSLRKLPTDENPAVAARIAEIRRTVAVSTGEKSLISALWRSIDLPGGPPPAAVLEPTVALTASTAARQVAAGDVLQLSPEVTDDDVDTVFVLVTEVQAQAALLTAFSSLGVPASRDEFLTGIDEEGLRVLSPWNAYWVPLVLTRQGWPVEIDTARLMADFAAYRESVLAGQGIPEHLQQRVGPPLNHPDDPRWAYYVQEGGKLIRVVELGLQIRR
jgi:hypothetical protein